MNRGQEKKEYQLAPCRETRRSFRTNGLWSWVAILSIAAGLWSSDSIGRADTLPATRLEAVLGLTNGFFAVDFEKSKFVPNDLFRASFRGTPEAAKRSLIESVNKALKNTGRAYINGLPLIQQNAIRVGSETNLTRFQAVQDITASWEQARDQFRIWAQSQGVTDESEQKAWLATSLKSLVSSEGRLGRELGATPLLWSDFDPTDQEASDALENGTLRLIVAHPFDADDAVGSTIGFGNNSDAFKHLGLNTNHLGRLLRSFEGELWSQALIQREVGDFFLELGLESSNDELDERTNRQWRFGKFTSFEDKDSDFHRIRFIRPSGERRVVVEGPPRIGAIQIQIPHTNTALLREILWLCLPHQHFQALAQAPERFIEKTTGAMIGMNEVQFSILRYTTPSGLQLPKTAPYLDHRELAKLQAELLKLHYRTLLFDEMPPLNGGFSDTRWVKLVLLPIASATTDTTSSAVDSGKNISKANAQFENTEYKNHLKLTAGLASGQPVLTVLEYSRDNIATNDSASVKAGFRGDLLFGANYTRDFVGFESIDRRLSISVSGDSDFQANRLVDNVRTDERRSGGRISAQLELLRNENANWLRIDAALEHQEIQLQELSLAERRTGVSRASIGLSYSWSPELRLGAPVLEITPSIDFMRSTHNQSFAAKPSISLGYHRGLPSFFEVSSRANVTFASAGTPATELPRFGGEDSVRGFRYEAASGRFTWTVRSELWIPLRFVRHWGETVDVLLRRDLKVAVFIDIGGVEKSLQPVSIFEAAAGVGLRYRVQDQAALQLDWAVPVTNRNRDLGGGTLYFSISLKPAHF